MMKRIIGNMLAFVMILLMICTSATASQGTPLWLDTLDDRPDLLWLDTLDDRPDLRKWLDAVAAIELDHVFPLHYLDGRIRFIEAMKDAGFEIDSKLYSVLIDEALDAVSRNAAAVEIIEIYYGDARRAYNQTDAGLLISRDEGELDAYLVFQVAYYNEFPDATKQEFTDAWGYWQRDILRMWEASPARVKLMEQLANFVYNEADIIRYMKLELKEMFGLENETIVEAAVIHDVFYEEYQLWYCTGTIDKEIVKAYFDDHNKRGEDCSGHAPFNHVFDVDDSLKEFDNCQEVFEVSIKNGAVLDLGDAYQFQLVAESRGFVQGGVTLGKYVAKKAADDAARPISNYSSDECEKIAFEGVMSHFMLSQEELDQYFLRSNSLFRDVDNNAQMVVLFDEHYYNDNRAWTYGAIVNAGTGELLDCFTQDMLKERPPKFSKPHSTLTRIVIEDVIWLCLGIDFHWTEE